MKEKGIFANPFRMMSPRLDTEVTRLEDYYKKPYAESVSLEEGLLIMISKEIELTRILSKCVVTCPEAQAQQCQALAEEVRRQEKVLTKDLVSSKVRGELLKGVIRFPYRLERIGDLLEGILRCCRTKTRDHIPFSEKAHAELDQLFAVLLDMMANLRDAFRTPNKILLEHILSQGDKLRQMVEDFKITHWDRLEGGYCAVEASPVYRDILDSFRLINEYLEKMAKTLLDLGDRVGAERAAG
ncbi:MAG: hypothetical protein AB1664_07795 [Thermodesulfobacteriota bacterium]